MAAEPEHHRLLEFERKLDATIGDGADVLARVRATCIQWPADLWMIRLLGQLHHAHRMIEIGTHQGGSALWLAWCFRPREIICIDPWLGMAGPAEETLRIFDEIRRFAWDRLGVTLTPMQGNAEDILPTLPDGAFGGVYVDGYHAEVFVEKDLRLGWPKVENAGLLFGHDYCAEHPDHLGVVRAVNAWEMEPAVTLLGPSRVFVARKGLGGI